MTRLVLCETALMTVIMFLVQYSIAFESSYDSAFDETGMRDICRKLVFVDFCRVGLGLRPGITSM